MYSAFLLLSDLPKPFTLLHIWEFGEMVESDLVTALSVVPASSKVGHQAANNAKIEFFMLVGLYHETDSANAWISS